MRVDAARATAAGILLCFCGVLHAQQRPDAGQILRDQPKPAPVVPTKPAPLKPVAPEAEPPDSNVRVRVNGFRIEGARLIPEAELAAQLQDAVGRDLTFRELRATASRLVDYYVDKGYMARAVVPPQEVRGGIIAVRIVEGRRGAVRIQQQEGNRADPARIQGFVEHRLRLSDVLDLEKLGESLIILNEQPGVDVVAVLEPGRTEADVDVVVEAADRPLATFELRANNHGSRASGQVQAGGVVGLANPLGLFEEATLLFNASEGTTFLRGDYSLAVGDSGLRAGVNAAALRYRLTQDAFAGLDARGTANTLGVNVTYPIARRTGYTLGVLGSFDWKRLRDQTIAGETSNRRVGVAAAGVAGTTADEWFGGGGISQFGATVSAGDTDERNAAALAADRAGRQVQGGFTKLGITLARLQQLGGPFSASAQLRGQMVSRAVDSSERFSLGGPNTIRAYPVGEALADQGWFGSIAALYNVGAGATASAFYDAGGVCLNYKTFPGWEGANARLRNCYRLAGFGLGFDWRPVRWGVLTASIARPVGDNPGRDINDLNADGRRNGTRGWVSISVQF